MKPSLLRVALVSAAAWCVSSPAQADHDWNNYHWGLTSTNQRFDVLTRFSQPHWESIVAKAVTDWDSDNDRGSYTDYLNPVIAGTATVDPKKCSPTAGKIIVCSASYGFRGWLGIATIWNSGGHIVQATTKLNDSYHNSGTYSSLAWRSAVACQEIGHDFGLGHQDEDFNTDATESCMEYTSLPEGNETPDAHDFEELDRLYDAHFAGDSGGGGGGGGPGRGNRLDDPFTFRQVGKTLPGANPIVSGDWGAAVGYDAHGRPNEFVQDVGGGLRKITHVTWLPGFRPESHHMRDQ